MLQSAEHGGNTTPRIVLLDAVRAFAIMSMVIGHIANYSFLWRTTHFAYYVWDGAQLFMLVSGIVVGLVHRKVVDRRGFGASAGKLARRAGLLFALQFGLVLLGLATASAVHTSLTADFWPDGITGWPDALARAALLGVNPIYINFLSSYVIILLLAIPMVWLLKTRHVAVTLAVAAFAYVLGLVLPQAFVLPNGPADIAGFNNATWFALFATGMVVGWKWHCWRVSTVIESRPVTWIASIAWVLLIGVAVIDAVRPSVLEDVDWWFDKNEMTPGRFVASWVFFIMLYWLVAEVSRQRWGATVIEPLEVLGARALDSVVILTVASILIPAVFAQPSYGHFAQAMSLVVLAVCWAWAYARRAYRLRSLRGLGSLGTSRQRLEADARVLTGS